MRRSAALVLLVCALGAHAEGVPLTAHTLRAAPDATPPQVGLEAMAWLAGRWRAAAFGGTGEETWLPPRGGAMTGVYRQVGDDGVAFYEILVIRETAGTLLLQLRHFDPALRAWEARDETVDFPLVAVAEGRIDFEGMRFEHGGADTMTVWLAVDDGAAEVRFDYRRF